MGKNTFVIEFAGITASRSIYIKKPEIQNGFWSDPKTGAGLKEATYGEKVKFTVGTKDIDDGTVLNFTLYDYDGNYNLDDELSRSFSARVKNNLAELEFIPDITWEESAKYETDKVVETYFKVETEIEEKKLTPNPKSQKKLTTKLPKKENEYLKIYPKEVKITVLVELPHSSYSLLNGVLELNTNEIISAKGLAGHTAMAIGDRYFDYGPDYATTTIINEKKYDYDFNEDGDKKDIIDLKKTDSKGAPLYNISPHFSPGKPWWGDHIARKKGIKPDDVTLDMALKHIQLHWRGSEHPIGSSRYPNATGIYGTVYKIELYVDKIDADKMIDWWENRYNHLKLYSVRPWDGQQCTTTTKKALQTGGILIPTETLKPVGILNDLKMVLSTSTKNKGKKQI